jgi:kumamolisin
MNDRFVFHGSARELAPGFRATGDVTPEKRVDVTLLLRSPPDMPSIAETAARVVRERAPLTHEEYFARYQASEADVAAVARFAEAHGLQIAIHRRERYAVLAGEARRVQAAFGVGLRSCERDGNVYRTHTEDVSVPAELRGVVRAVFGLSDVPVAHPASQLARQGAARRVASRAAARRASAPTDPVPWTSYTPPEYARMYDFPSELTGAGACVGVLELYGGFDPADMVHFFRALGMEMPDIRTVGPNQRATGADVWSNFEVTMDIQIAASCAPQARCVAYFSGAKGFEDTTWKSYVDVISKAIFDTENKPDVLTMSWGLQEWLPGVPGDWRKWEAEIVDEFFAIAAILGITVVLPSGDSGSLYPVAGVGFNAPSLVYYPGSSPWGLCVGGTTVQVRDGKIVAEVVWNRFGRNMNLIYGDSLSLCNLGSSGGGVSYYFERPAWQARAGVPDAWLCDFTEWSFSNPTSFAGRGCPDVAANADFLVGYAVYVDGQWRYGGGTSASTPFTASLMTRIRGGIGTPLGFVTPLLYELQIERGVDVLQPVVVGNNAGYAAGDGGRWNPCAGLGAIRGRAMYTALRAAFGA